MSPEHFRRFVLPSLRKAVASVKALGAACIKHTDGNIWPIIDDIVETGVDALGPLEPGAGMILSEVKRRFGDRVAVVGNVDVDLLSRGSPEEVVAAVSSLIRDVSAGGGHILSSGNTIAASVRPENYRAMVETARSQGGSSEPRQHRPPRYRSRPGGRLLGEQSAAHRDRRTPLHGGAGTLGGQRGALEPDPGRLRPGSPGQHGLSAHRPRSCAGSAPPGGGAPGTRSRQPWGDQAAGDSPRGGRSGLRRASGNSFPASAP